jgi:hypothetical protein
LVSEIYSTKLPNGVVELDSVIETVDPSERVSSE